MLSSLNISYNKGGDLAVQSLVNLVDKCTHLRELDISFTGISKQNAVKLADGFAKSWEKNWNLNSSLRKIVWKDCPAKDQV